MKKAALIVICTVVLVAFMGIGGVSAKQAKQAKHKASIKVATISLDEAINAALLAVPGKVLKAELENENGTLVYDVEILKDDGQKVEVKIDAGTGKVLKIESDENETEDEYEDASDNGMDEGGETQ